MADERLDEVILIGRWLSTLIHASWTPHRRCTVRIQIQKILVEPEVDMGDLSPRRHSYLILLMTTVLSLAVSTSTSVELAHTHPGHVAATSKAVQSDRRGLVEKQNGESGKLPPFSLPSLFTSWHRADLLSQNAELFSFTYGALVVQLIKDYEDYVEVNKQLEKM